MLVPLIIVGVFFYLAVSGVVWQMMDDASHYKDEFVMFFTAMFWPLAAPVWLGMHTAPVCKALGPSGRRDRAYKKREWARQEAYKQAQHQVALDKLALEQVRLLDQAIKEANE